MSDVLMSLSLGKMTAHYADVLDYLMRSSDELTLVMHMVKPYSASPNPCAERQYSQALEKHLISQRLNAREWSGTQTSERHLALCRYKCARSITALLLDLPSLFDLQWKVIPQDLCLYRQGRCWFSVTSHEMWAFLINPTSRDSDFFVPYAGSDRPVF